MAIIPSIGDYLPQRVACLQPSATVTLRDLGWLRRVVACTKYCVDLCPELKRAGKTRPAIISDSWSAQSQQIRAAKPELVIASVPYRLEAVAEILKSGARFLGLAPRTLADVYADTLAIARIMGVEQRGFGLVSDMKREVASAQKSTAKAQRPLVFCEEWGKPLIASQPWVAELVEAAGGEFSGTPGAQQTFDDVLARNPEIVIAAWCGAGDRVPLEKLAAMRGWRDMQAFRNGRVYCIRDEFLNTPAGTLMWGLRALAWAIHPELFARPPGIRRIGEFARKSASTRERVV